MCSKIYNLYHNHCLSCCESIRHQECHFRKIRRLSRHQRFPQPPNKVTPCDKFLCILAPKAVTCATYITTWIGSNSLTFTSLFIAFVSTFIVSIANINWVNTSSIIAGEFISIAAEQFILATRTIHYSIAGPKARNTSTRYVAGEFIWGATWFWEKVQF